MTEDNDYTFDGAAIPDVLAHFGRVNGWSGGVRTLMIAVFEDGIRCFMSPDGETRAEAEEWLTCDERGYVFAFLTICDALDMDGAPLSRPHGAPARVVVPRMYGYKSVKWVSRIELLTETDHRGYWEQRGYDRDAWVDGSNGLGA